MCFFRDFIFRRKKPGLVEGLGLGVRVRIIHRSTSYEEKLRLCICSTFCRRISQKHAKITLIIGLKSQKITQISQKHTYYRPKKSKNYSIKSIGGGTKKYCTFTDFCSIPHVSQGKIVVKTGVFFVFLLGWGEAGQGLGLVRKAVSRRKLRHFRN